MAGDSLPIFTGPPEAIRAFLDWLDPFERAIVTRTSEGLFVVDLDELNVVLSIAGNHLHCLNPVDASKLSETLRELQKQATALLARGVQAWIDPTPEDVELARTVETVKEKAARHITWLRLQAKDALSKLDAPQSTAAENGKPPVPDGPTGLHSSRELAQVMGIPEQKRGAFEKALERLRPRLSEKDWQEASDVKHRHPRFSYRAESVVIKELAAKYTT